MKSHDMLSSKSTRNDVTRRPRRFYDALPLWSEEIGESESGPGKQKLMRKCEHPRRTTFVSSLSQDVSLSVRRGRTRRQDSIRWRSFSEKTKTGTVRCLKATKPHLLTGRFSWENFVWILQDFFEFHGWILRIKIYPGSHVESVYV